MLFKGELPKHFAVHHGSGLVYVLLKGWPGKEKFLWDAFRQEHQEILPYGKHSPAQSFTDSAPIWYNIVFLDYGKK